MSLFTKDLNWSIDLICPSYGIDKLIINEKDNSTERFRLHPHAKAITQRKEELIKASQSAFQ